jgi:hypothetical protein
MARTQDPFCSKLSTDYHLSTHRVIHQNKLGILLPEKVWNKHPHSTPLYGFVKPLIRNGFPRHFPRMNWEIPLTPKIPHDIPYHPKNFGVAPDGCNFGAEPGGAAKQHRKGAHPAR